MRNRTYAVAGAGLGAAVLAATGITYASTTGSTPASPSVQRAAQPVQQSAPTAVASAGNSASGAKNESPNHESNGSGSGEKNQGGNHESGGRANGEKDERDERDEGHDHERGERGYGHKEEGRIYFNDREYSAAAEGCITAVSGLGSSSFSVFNDSRKTVEVFRGFTCDNGAPVATVGPHGETDGVVTRTGHGSMFGDDGVVGSFRVIGHHDEW